MTSTPVISVAMATYNGGRYLREQLDSIYQPCGVAFEVVVSDDASNDETRSILAEYARSRGLRDVSDGRRRGLVANFERAMQHCGGDYVALSDQDDVWLEGRLDTLLRTIEGHDAVYSLIERVLRPDGSIGAWNAPAGMREFVARYGTGKPTPYLLASNWAISHTMLLRRAVVQAALPIPPTQPYHDGWLATAASALGTIRALEPSPTLYRQHDASLTAASPPDNRRWFGRAAGLPRATWITKCRAEIARLESLRAASFLSPADREFASALSRYYERGLRRGLSLRSGFAARRLANFFYSSADARWRRNFILRGFFGAI